jgi:hypothetical protein
MAMVDLLTGELNLNDGTQSDLGSLRLVTLPSNIAGIHYCSIALAKGFTASTRRPVKIRRRMSTTTRPFSGSGSSDKKSVVFRCFHPNFWISRIFRNLPRTTVPNKMS